MCLRLQPFKPSDFTYHQVKVRFMQALLMLSSSCHASLHCHKACNEACFTRLADAVSQIAQLLTVKREQEISAGVGLRQARKTEQCATLHASCSCSPLA